MNLDKLALTGFILRAMDRTMPTIGRVMMAVALLLSFGIDFSNTSQGGAIDLRNRITGLRLLEHGIDPYHYKWSRSEPEEYCDPFNNPKLEVSRTTATPALLLVNVPLAPMPYRPAQLLWFVMQWALLLGTGWLWWRRCETSRQRWLVALAVTGFSYTAAWRLHAERGQTYVLFAFLFVCWLTLTLTLTLDPKRGSRLLDFTGGCIAGFLIAARPPFALLLPFLALHRRGQLPGSVAGLLLGIGLPMLWLPGCWSDYFSAMKVNALLNQTHYYPHFSQAYPPRIEGVPTDILAHYAPLPFAEFSFPALLNWLGFAPLPDDALLLAVAVVFAVWLWVTYKESTESLLPGLAGWFFLADLFLPAYRNSYNDVLILDVICVGLVLTKQFPWTAWPCAVALPLGWAVYAWAPEQAWLINLPTLFFTLGAIQTALCSTFLFNNRAGSRKVAGAC